MPRHYCSLVPVSREIADRERPQLSFAPHNYGRNTGMNRRRNLIQCRADLAGGEVRLKTGIVIAEGWNMTPRLEIEYCRQCRWLLRAAWLAQELLTTFEKELGEVALVPGTNGIFEVRLVGETIFSRRQQGRFPESKELKQLVRDRIAPEKHLGHSDR
jgi:selenoprotein W-related protein